MGLNKVLTYLSKPQNLVLLILGIVLSITTIGPIISIIADTVTVHIGSVDSANTGLLTNWIDLFTGSLRTVFDAVVDGTEIQHSKPDPEVFLTAAKKLHEKLENCIVVEDAAAGIEAAKKANMTAVAVSDARHSVLADYCVDDIAEVAAIARSLCP